ncbi:hypothetical protein PC129_g15655, partial [Phytophthora cactorum]
VKEGMPAGKEDEWWDRKNASREAAPRKGTRKLKRGSPNVIL